MARKVVSALLPCGATLAFWGGIVALFYFFVPEPLETITQLFIVLIGIAAVATVVAIALWLYFLPTVVAAARGHGDVLAIFVLNLLFGLTFIGWGLALVWACRAVQIPLGERKYYNVSGQLFSFAVVVAGVSVIAWIFTRPDFEQFGMESVSPKLAFWETLFVTFSGIIGSVVGIINKWRLANGKTASQYEEPV